MSLLGGRRETLSRTFTRRRGPPTLFLYDAATILLRSVPRPTKKRKLAMDACLQVLRGEAQTPVARRAFVTAALEAKILRSD
ncbi:MULTISPECIES: DUF982 domain-containing protein [unclassified Mesorhizobium]|uniref:DUF982 domain-containing protein n=1 Tax=unclassified Mesorhizobium TaxID=325217 RepID=UPI0033381ED8